MRPVRPGTDHHSSWNTPSAASSLRATSKIRSTSSGLAAQLRPGGQGGHHRGHQRVGGDGGHGVSRPTTVTVAGSRPTSSVGLAEGSLDHRLARLETPAGEGHLARMGPEPVRAHGEHDPRLALLLEQGHQHGGRPAAGDRRQGEPRLSHRPGSTRKLEVQNLPHPVEGEAPPAGVGRPDHGAGAPGRLSGGRGMGRRITPGTASASASASASGSASASAGHMRASG